MHPVNVITLIFTFVIVVLPLGVGIWLALRGWRGGPDFPSCGKCRYDVTGSIGSATRCPECGSPFAEVGIVRPRGRHRPLLTIGGLILVVSAVGCMGTSLSLLMARKAQQARQAALISAQAAALAPTTRPAVDDPASTEEDLQPDQEPPE